jgi:hypothetical protein
MGFVVDRVAQGQVYPPEFFGFSLSTSFHLCPLLGEEQKIIIIFIFIIGLHKKPQG